MIEPDPNQVGNMENKSLFSIAATDEHTAVRTLTQFALDAHLAWLSYPKLYFHWKTDGNDTFPLLIEMIDIDNSDIDCYSILKSFPNWPRCYVINSIGQATAVFNQVFAALYAERRFLLSSIEHRLIESAIFEFLPVKDVSSIISDMILMELILVGIWTVDRSESQMYYLNSVQNCVFSIANEDGSSINRLLQVSMISAAKIICPSLQQSYKD